MQKPISKIVNANLEIWLFNMRVWHQELKYLNYYYKFYQTEILEVDFCRIPTSIVYPGKL